MKNVTFGIKPQQATGDIPCLLWYPHSLKNQVLCYSETMQTEIQNLIDLQFIE